MTGSIGFIGPDQPVSEQGCDTIARLFRQQCATWKNKTAHRDKELGIWRSYSWGDYYHDASLIGAGLLALGMQTADRVAILSEDNRDWLCCDLGITIAGGVPTGIYTTDSPQQLAYIVNDSGATFLIVENDEQLDKFLQVESELPGLVTVVVFDRQGLREFSHPRVMFFDELKDDRATQRRDDYPSQCDLSVKYLS